MEVADWWTFAESGSGVEAAAKKERLKKLAADLSLDKAMLRDIALKTGKPAVKTEGGTLFDTLL